MSLQIKAKISRFAVVVSVASALSACGGFDGIDLNGKVFDAVGLSTSSVSKTAEPKLKERAPLVVPPGLEGLPVPGSGKEAQAPLELQDHDAKKNLSQAELQQQQAEFCKKNYELPKAHGDESVDTIEGPLGSCRGSILSAIGKLNKPAESEDQ